MWGERKDKCAPHASQEKIGSKVRKTGGDYWATKPQQIPWYHRFLNQELDLKPSIQVLRVQDDGSPLSGVEDATKSS